MPGPASPAEIRTFPVKVEGLGTFTFRRRTIADEIAIQAGFDELTAGVERPSTYLDRLASALSTYRVICTHWPEGWSPQEVAAMDAVMDDRIKDLLRLYDALSVREDEFRPQARRRFQADRPLPGAQPGDVVPAQVQPPAD